MASEQLGVREPGTKLRMTCAMESGGGPEGSPECVCDVGTAL